MTTDMPVSYSVADAAQKSRAVSYYDAIAARYDADLSASAIDRLARRAFVDVVAQYVTPGSTLVDFGCGTGQDAAAYVRRGMRVLAWDPSAGMLNECRARLAAEGAVAQVLVAADRQPFDEFLDRRAGASALVANFAVLNMVADPAPLFALAAERLAPPGVLVLSVINPVAWHHLPRAWWWRGLAARWAGRPFANRTTEFDSYLHFVGGLRSAARGFHLIGLGTAGRCARYDEVRPSGVHLFWDDPQSGAGPIRRALWRSGVSRFLGRFTFIVLGRDR